MKGIVVDFRACDDGDALIHEVCQLTYDAALGLAAQSQENQVVARQYCVHNLRHDRFIIADDAGKKTLARAKFTHEISAHLVFDRAHAVIALFEFT